MRTGANIGSRYTFHMQFHMLQVTYGSRRNVGHQERKGARGACCRVGLEIPLVTRTLVNPLLHKAVDGYQADKQQEDNASQGRRHPEGYGDSRHFHFAAATCQETKRKTFLFGRTFAFYCSRTSALFSTRRLGPESITRVIDSQSPCMD